MEGITFYTEEFRLHNLHGDKQTPVNECSIITDQFYSSIASQSEHEQFYSINPPSKSSNQSSQQQHQSHHHQQHSDNENSDCDDDDHVQVFRSDPIAIAKLLNRQEFRIKMKQADNIPGPKVQLEITLGSLSVFVSPRQLHLLLRLSDVLLADSTDTKEKESPMHKGHQSPMDIDFSRNSNGIFSPMSGGVGFNQGWSSDIYSEYFLLKIV